MDSSRFDFFIRTISSRRGFSGSVVGTIAGLLELTLVHEVRAAQCPKGKKRCRKKCIPKRRCCTNAQCKPRNSGRVCKRGRCVCRAGTRPCGKRCLPRAVACRPTPDAFCLPGTEGVEFWPGMRITQTFTATNTGQLVAVAMWIRNDSAATTGTYELRLRRVDPDTGLPEAQTLATAQRSSDDVSDTTLDWVRFDFELIPPLVEAGEQYALLLSKTPSAPGSWVTWLMNPNPCPGGHLFGYSGGPEFELRPNQAIPYQTFVKP